MKHLTLAICAHVMLFASLYVQNVHAKAPNFDTSTLPILFFPQGESFHAKSPWYSLNYQKQSIQLQTCPKQACIQSLKFNDLEQFNQFDERHYQESYRGQVGNIQEQDTYSQLTLGYQQSNPLIASGNQRRVIFTLALNEQPGSITFEFTDDYQTTLTQELHTIQRISYVCSTSCKSTWQAFNIDKEGRYSSASFKRGDDGKWVIKSSANAVKVELTTLVGQYRSPEKRFDNEKVSVSSDTIAQDSIVTVQKDQQIKQYHLLNTQVVGLNEKHWLLHQDNTLLLTDHRAELIAAASLADYNLTKIIDSDLTKDRVFMLGFAAKYFEPRPAKRTVIAQYPRRRDNTLVGIQLIELDHALNLVSITPIYLPDSEIQHATIEQTMWGILVGTGEATAKSTNHSYQTNQSAGAMAGCPMIASGYGYGLLCWKALNNLTLTYTPNAASTMIPTTVVDNTTPTLMNQLEANQHGIIFKDGGMPVDPNGVWTFPDNAATSKENLALAIAMYHYRWNSPVAANIIYPSGSPAQPVMFREVTYHAANSSNLPHNVCNDFSASSGYPEYQAANACMSQTGFGLFSLMDLKFDRWQGGNYFPNQTISGADNSWFPWYTNYVGDPPVTELFQEQTSMEMIERIRDNSANYGYLTQDTYLNGRLFSQGHVLGYFRSWL